MSDKLAYARSRRKVEGSAAACPSCGHGMGRLWIHGHRGPVRTELYQCRTCGAVYRLQKVLA